MNRVAALNERYAASTAVARTGVELIAIGDPPGARFNNAVRRLGALVKDDGGPYLDDLLGASKALSWRQITQPQPLELNPGLRELAEEVTRRATRLFGSIADQKLLDELAASAALMASSSSAIGPVLLSSIEEVGATSCIVIAASHRAARGLGPWLRDHGVSVLTMAQLERIQSQYDQAYVVGPPRIYRPSLVTAPVTSEVSFLVPAWFRDRRVPHSAIAPYAEGAIRVETRVFTIGDTTESEIDIAEAEDEDVYLPHPIWGARKSDDREPRTDEVSARKILLSGNTGMWLDDGERIRSLAPGQPRGERVTYTDVPAVREGTYLLLKQGATERGVLYRAALAELGPQADAIDAAQVAWKKVLLLRIRERGYRSVVKDLRAVGVKTADRARAWTDPNLIRPNSDQDFEGLLDWLDIQIQPTFGYATMLRKKLYRVSAQIGRQLEAAVAAADLSDLETTGRLSLDIDSDGFRGIFATRVVAISPFEEIVPRNDARVPFEDRSGQWLE